MDNVGTLCLAGVCLFGVFAAFAVMSLFSRLGGGLGRGLGGSPFSRRGPLSPNYDDPDIESRGFFGRPRSSGRTTFGGSGRSGTSRRVDSDDIDSRGSFGRSKD